MIKTNLAGGAAGRTRFKGKRRAPANPMLPNEPPVSAAKQLVPELSGALGLDDDECDRLHHSICLLPRGRVVCRSSIDATATFLPHKRSGTVVGACRAKRSPWIPCSFRGSFRGSSSSAWRKSTARFHLVATASYSMKPTGDFEWRVAARRCKE